MVACVWEHEIEMNYFPCCGTNGANEKLRTFKESLPEFPLSPSPLRFFSSYAFVLLTQDSSFVRIHKVIKVLNFTMKTTDLQLSDVFLKALAHLPLEYNSALYSRIFDDFGTHYFTSGSLGGKYDLLYQFSRQELQNSGAWASLNLTQQQHGMHLFPHSLTLLLHSSPTPSL